VDEITGAKDESSAQVGDELRPEDEYDLVIVLIRKNKLSPVLKTLAASDRIKSILFMGNNALGFGSYLDALAEEEVLFGFPGAGGGVSPYGLGGLDHKMGQTDKLVGKAGVDVFYHITPD
jgi:hypothetical protein